ncbi:MAG: LLM class flavin-dependent oxidoreductase, partial [Candidatus Caldarchaeum sp.]|nr:LLM class flavin-dependent oxidoreductase [Candidatus Caldarchaeum sp.]MDW8436080.1 LLM class flavin-dependent oxidoreductase [Candidatus Caldarchaeum sp.]
DSRTYLRYSVEAEDKGFDFVFFADSQMIYRDPFVNMAVVSEVTSKVKMGTLATSVITRHPTVIACSAVTLHELSRGRMILVLGTGDSSVRRIGMNPASLAEFEKSVYLIQRLMRGEKLSFGSYDFGIGFARDGPPVYTIATGPKVLQLSGRVGDGAVVNVGPALTSWALNNVRRGAVEAGLDPHKRDLFWCGFCMVDEDRRRAIARVKPSVSWFAVNFPRMIEETGVNPTKELWDEVEKFRRNYARYDLVHSDVWEQAVRDASFIPDDIAKKLALAGTPEDIIHELRRLEGLGIEKVIIRPPSTEDWKQVFTLFADYVLPTFK